MLKDIHLFAEDKKVCAKWQISNAKNKYKFWVLQKSPEFM
jgi:hypothetical protein